MSTATARRTAEQIVDAVADAALGLLIERSPSAVSMRDIAAAADVNLGLIHRYVGSKSDVIALVLARHTERARRAAETAASDGELFSLVADTVVNRPDSGRLIAGMILDGVDVAELKGDFPLLARIAAESTALPAALTYALALGWEVFGPTLLEALGDDPNPDETAAAVARALGAVLSAPSTTR